MILLRKIKKKPLLKDEYSFVSFELLWITSRSY